MRSRPQRKALISGWTKVAHTTTSSNSVEAHAAGSGGGAHDTPTMLVTGATGFLGSHVARLLLANGADLRLLVRPTSDLRNINALKADRVVGDLRDAASLKKAMVGCDFVFHVAADYRLWTKNKADAQEMYRSNVDGNAFVDPGCAGSESSTRSLHEQRRNDGISGRWFHGG